MNFDIDSIRKDFPILSRKVHGQDLVYLDNAASAQKPQAVIDAIIHCHTDYYANIHRGVHLLSQEVTETYENARKTVASFINAHSSNEIIFTRGATESINLVAHSFGKSHLKAGENIVISTLEHHANIVPWQLICEEKGAELRVIPMSDEGELEIDSLDQLIDEKTSLVAVNLASNALGTINPIKSIIEKAHAQGAAMLVDAAQALPHFGVDVEDLDCEFLVFSGHKLFGPTGIGVLYGKEALLNSLPPYQSGGDMIEHVSFEKTTFKECPSRFEAGTPNIVGAIGLAAAIDYLNQFENGASIKHEQAILARATERLESIPGLKIVGQAKNKVSLISFVMEGIHPHDIGTVLDTRGIAIRTGHHCCEPLMNRLGLPGTNRASFAFYNTFEEVDKLAEALISVQKLFS